MIDFSNGFATITLGEYGNALHTLLAVELESHLQKYTADVDYVLHIGRGDDIAHQVDIYNRAILKNRRIKQILKTFLN